MPPRPRWRASWGLPGICGQQGCHAAGDPQSSPRRLWRKWTAMRSCTPFPWRWTDALSRPALAHRRNARLGPCAEAWQAPWLSQRPGHGDRAHRHHRACDGLRHHRGRAGFRPGQIQDPGGRRLFQDHQPRVPDALRSLGYGSAEIDAIVDYAVGHGTLANTPAINYDALRGKGFGEDEIRQSRVASKRPLTSASCSTNSPWARISAATF